MFTPVVSEVARGSAHVPHATPASAANQRALVTASLILCPTRASNGSANGRGAQVRL